MYLIIVHVINDHSIDFHYQLNFYTDNHNLEENPRVQVKNWIYHSQLNCKKKRIKIMKFLRNCILQFIFCTYSPIE